MKILIIHSSAGAGHTKAAEAVYDQINDHSDHNVVLVDALDYTSEKFKKLYQNGYAFLIGKVPWLWGAFFWLWDRKWIYGFTRFIRRSTNANIAKRLEAYLKQENFDWIISTHFLSNEVASFVKGTGAITSKIICAVTDYDVHSIWLAENIDYYTVATPFTKQKLASMGVAEEKIFTTGIPTNSKFSAPKDLAAIKESLHLKDDVFTVLIATGSFGIGPIEPIVNALAGFQVLVVCGRNSNLYCKLHRKESDIIHIYGLVDNMHELMAVSDAMITKPGGLSISEALVSELPLIFFNPIPGQETNNIEVLKQFGVGCGTGTMETIISETQKLKESKEYFDQMKANVKQLARPSAVQEILQIIR